MVVATFVIRRSDQIPVPGQPGYFTARFPTKSTTSVLSVQPDRTIEPRPIGTTGPWEVHRNEGNRAVFEDVAGFTFAIPLVD
jgi:hypothetical protein